MRKVIWSDHIQKKEYQPNGVTIKKQYMALEDQGEALFHQWGVDSPCEGSTFSTAIIELEDGTIKNIPAEQIRFISGDLDKVIIEGSPVKIELKKGAES